LRPVALVSLETAVPSYSIDQVDVAAFARSVFEGRHEDFPRLANVFATAGIRTRYAVRPLEWFQRPRDWADRMTAYADGAQALFTSVARKALAAAGLTGRDIDTIVTVSSTGIAAPTLEARAFKDLGFREDVRRVPVFGLGCAGGAAGLGLASRLAAAEPGDRVLLVVVELCTLAFRLDKPTKSNIVASALFGDGTAACVLQSVSASDGGPGGVLATVESSGEHLWPDTLDIMGWAIDPQGFDVIFSRTIPPFAQANARTAAAAVLARSDLRLDDIDRFVFHPGGAKVITALERGLSLDRGTLADERAVLADYGNMSAPTVLFVLKRALAAGIHGRILMSAMGPGFTLNCVTLRTAV
jgi:alkylresorcinol/alkylpyrone synthase